MATNQNKSKTNYWKYSWAKRIDSYLINLLIIRNFLRQAFIRLQSTNNRRKVKGNNNQINIKESIFKNSTIDIHGNNNTVDINSQAIIENLTIYVRGCSHQISIGSNCRFTRGGTIWIEDDKCSLTVGANTFILKAHISLTESNSSIEIGQDCMLSSDIEIRTVDPPTQSLICQQEKESIMLAILKLKIMFGLALMLKSLRE